VVGAVMAVVFLYQINCFYFTTKHHFRNFILMTQCKLCTRAAAAEVAVNETGRRWGRWARGPM